MKYKFTHIQIAIIVLLTMFSFLAAAQAPTPFAGASDATTAPPTTAGAVGQVLCNGSPIMLKGPADATGTMKYQWYKVDPSGTKELVKEGVNKDNVYTETSTNAGYYTYQLVLENSNDCSSDPSDLFKLYVLPALNASISGNGTVCANGQTNSVLSIDGLDSRFTYTYQWIRNGATITTNGNSNTYTVTEQTSGSATYSVKVAYVLNATCAQTTAVKPITIAPIPDKPTIQLGN